MSTLPILTEPQARLLREMAGGRTKVPDHLKSVLHLLDIGLVEPASCECGHWSITVRGRDVVAQLDEVKP